MGNGLGFCLILGTDCELVMWLVSSCDDGVY